ncbi:MAG: hypothetical protein H0U80_05510 [Solirubrobacterales bacterium]|nr:hypothetical protein [Solirubrobacterales bacterium]
MVEEGLIGGLVLAEMFGYRRAMFGRPPSRPLRLIPAALVSLVIHIGFHAAATMAPSVATAIAFVFAGWTTFYIWWRWVARAPDPWGFDEGEDGGGGGGPGGGGPGLGPDRDGQDPGGGGREIDWEEREREMGDFLTPDRTLVGAT